MPDRFPDNPSSAVEALDAVIAYAVAASASDVHCDPGPVGISVRIRVDGCVRAAGILPLRLHEELVSRAKILAGARTDLHTVPQDGRWRAEVAGQSYHLRASFMPTYHGENIVLRVLKADRSTTPSFAELGFAPDHAAVIGAALEHTSGLILVTGPTGSGKTTTLHACLAAKARQPLSIITLEDPVEYEILGVRQVHIRHSHGVTFAAGLRAALRQDPDVIMVGEIRDAETAHVAIHTALTGHLVLSTIHTTSALETIPRLIDMDIDQYLVASTLRLIIAQRLVRSLCRGCAGDGCEQCAQQGYRGRSVIAEVCEVDAGLKDLILRREGASAYLAHCRTRGFRPMLEDGMEKEEWGITTRHEIVRALHD